MLFIVRFQLSITKSCNGMMKNESLFWKMMFISSKFLVLVFNAIKLLLVYITFFLLINTNKRGKVNCLIPIPSWYSSYVFLTIYLYCFCIRCFLGVFEYRVQHFTLVLSCTIYCAKDVLNNMLILCYFVDVIISFWF